MRWRDIICEMTVEPSLLDGFDMTSVQTFVDSIRRVPQEQTKRLQGLLDQLRNEVRPTGWLELYHGTPTSKAQSIISNGFQLGKGERGLGFMGATYTVDCQGIFLTDSKKLASLFGSTRDDINGVNYRVLTCYVDPTAIIDYADIPRPVFRLGLAISHQRFGRSQTRSRLNQHDWWALLDEPEFVSALREAGVRGLRFKEEIDVRRRAGDLNAHTYFVIDPSQVRILEREGWTIEKFYEWLKSRS